jgi:hypothetical protein
MDVVAREAQYCTFVYSVWGVFCRGFIRLRAQGSYNELSINYHNQSNNKLNVCTVSYNYMKNLGEYSSKGVSPIESQGSSNRALNQLPTFNLILF